MLQFHVYISLSLYMYLLKCKVRVLNPDYDASKKDSYETRESRKEWSYVGMMGKLRMLKGQPTGDRWIKMRDISDTVEEWLVR